VDEAEFVYEKCCDTLVLSSGQYGNVHLSPEAAEFFADHDRRVVLQPTPQAIKAYNKAKGRAIGLFHVTCRAVPGHKRQRCSRPAKLPFLQSSLATIAGMIAGEVM